MLKLFGNSRLGNSWLGNSWLIRIGAVLAAQAVLLTLAISPQLSARLNGNEYEARVAGLDPMEPGRGAYVGLDYPDLPTSDSDWNGQADWNGQEGTVVYVPVKEQGGRLVGQLPTKSKPDGLFLKCADMGWRIDCGIDSFFLPQDEALQMEADLAEKQVIAVIRIDRWGNATVVKLRIED